MIKNKINVKLSVPVKCYQMYAYPLAVIFKKEKEAENWCFSNFINFRLARNGYIVDVRYTEPRYEKCYYYSERLVSQSLFLDESLGNVKEFIIKCIDNQDVVSLFVDEFYINHRIRYQKEHKVHQIMVNGYDKDKNIFYILGYNENRKYTEATIPMEEFIHGFMNCPVIANLSEYIKIFRIIETDKRCELSLTDFKKELLNFYNSSTYVNLDQYEQIYGLKVYDAFIETVNDYGYEYENYPMLYMLGEAKQNMFDKLKLLECFGWDFTYEKTLYKKLQNLMQSNFKTFSKRIYIAKDSKRFRDVSNRIVNDFQRIKVIEEECVYRILNKMEYQ